jgi:hypothetical protein
MTRPTETTLKRKNPWTAAFAALLGLAILLAIPFLALIAFALIAAKMIP